MATASTDLQQLAAQLSETVNSPLTTGPEQNVAVAGIAEKILAAVKPPMPEVMGLFSNMGQVVALRLFVKWGVLAAIPAHGAISYAELAAKVDADASLITRLAWILVSQGILTQVGEDHVAHTPRSTQYLPFTPNAIMLQMIYDESMVSITRLPEYFDHYGRKEPASQLHTPYAYGNGQPDKNVWEIQNQDPERMKLFMMAMAMSDKFIPITEGYDFDWVREKIGSEDAQRVLLVDVGGSKGHAIKSICQENDFLPPARCVLEDREEVIQELRTAADSELSGVELVAHDFHTAQPVKGALIYWIRRCLHDYGDDVCVGILKHLADAMAPDSRVLVVEQVITNPPPLRTAAIDFAMMNLGGKERTRKGFEDIAGRAGLKVAKVHGETNGSIHVVECVLA